MIVRASSMRKELQGFIEGIAKFPNVDLFGYYVDVLDLFALNTRIYIASIIIRTSVIQSS